MVQIAAQADEIRRLRERLHESESALAVANRELGERAVITAERDTAIAECDTLRNCVMELAKLQADEECRRENCKTAIPSEDCCQHCAENVSLVQHYCKCLNVLTEVFNRFILLML